MKSIIILIYSVLSPLIVSTQNWEQIGNGTNDVVRELFADTVDNVLYVGGHFKYIGDPLVSDDTLAVNGIAKWTGSEYLPLGTGMDYCSFDCNPVFSIFRFGEDIFCNASSPSFSGVEVSGIARWDGVSWNSVGGGLWNEFNHSGSVLCQMRHQDALLVGGVFLLAGTDTVNSLASWDGVNWHSMNFPAVPNSDPFINAMTVHEGELYVGGNFQSIIDGEVVSDIAKFDGLNWKKAGSELVGNWTSIADIKVFKNELYIAGLIKASEGNAGNMIMKLHNGQWVDVGGEVEGSGQIHDMVIFQDELYVVGGFYEIGDGVPAQHIAKWTGERWCGIGSEFNNTILTAEVFNDELYIGGGFTIIDGDTINYIAKWTGGNFPDTCGLPVGTSDFIISENGYLLATPNPAHSTLQIKSTLPFPVTEAVILYASNLLGEAVYEESIQPNSSTIEKEIDVSTWLPGLYFLRLEAAGQVWVQKVVVQH